MCDMFPCELTSLNITEGEESDANVSVHRPLLRFTVWAAAVVHKPRRVSFRAGVDHTILRRKTDIKTPGCKEMLGGGLSTEQCLSMSMMLPW